MSAPVSQEGSVSPTDHIAEDRSLDPEYLGLESEIKELKEKVEPLQAEVITTPMWPVVARIMNLSTASDERASEIRQRIAECKRLLNEMAFDWVSQIIAKPEPSKVFRVVNNTNIFERELNSAVGRRIELSGGYSVELTPALAKFLTRFKFSIGTPPITKKGIETIEGIIFGGQLGDVYGFRNLLGTEIDVFDRFMKVVDRTVEQSTHYTTAGEKKEFERDARDHTNMEGMRGFTKTAVSGSAKTAHRLIREHLFSQHRNGNSPLKEFEAGDLNDPKEVKKLTKAMREDRTNIFIVKVKAVPHNVFTTDELKEEWKGLLGRLILIEESETSQRSATTMVYSFHPDITSCLAQWQVKNSGTLANTQLNLRSLMEGFSDEELARMKGKIAEKITYFESQGVNSKDVSRDRKKAWVVSTQKDYVALQRFKRFLDFIEQIKSGEEEDFEALKAKMIVNLETLEKDYFFSDLPDADYKCLYVPQGGGRKELGLIGKYHLGRHNQKVAEFRKKHLDPESPSIRTKLNALKAARGYSAETSVVEEDARERALSGLESPDQAIQDFETASQEPLNGIRERIRQAVYKGSLDIETLVKDILMDSLDSIIGKNVPGFLKKQLAALLEKANLSSASKIFERPPFRPWANKFRSWEGRIRRWVDEELATPILEKSRGVQRKFENRSLGLAEKMINDIEKKGAFEPHLVMAEMGWSFDDVMREDDYPAQNHIPIDVDQNGELKLKSLEKHLESIQAKLHEFPELFELYCSSILLVFNDPHNPTSKVADRETKLKLLNIASKYDLSILADEAYHKMIDKDKKDEEGDLSLASFYQQNLPEFSGHISIYTSLPSTKWGMGAGRRSGVILTNDLDSHVIINEKGESVPTTFEDFVRSNTDGVNMMSMWFDQETLNTGIAVKGVCKRLEDVFKNPFPDPVDVTDEIIQEMVAGIDSSDFQGPIYFKLLAARNDMDRLMIREAGPIVMRQYVSDLMASLKEMRLDKQTRKDTENRVKAGVKAIARLSKKIPGLEERYIKPEGPFYLCVNFDETQKDSGLMPCMEAFAKARGIDGVHVGKGDVRFSFGGMLDGTPESYEMLSVWFEKVLAQALDYWERFKTERTLLNKKKDPDPTYHALQNIFPSGEDKPEVALQDRGQLVYFHELLKESASQDVLKKIARELVKRAPKTAEAAPKLNGKSELGEVLNAVPEKDMALILGYLKKYKLLKAQFEEQEDEEADLHSMQDIFAGEIELPENPEALRMLINNFARYKEKGKSPLVFTVSSDASKYISQIQPDSQSSIVTIKGVKCPDMKTFIESKPFQDLFNFYLLKVKDKIPKLKNLTDGEILGSYEALRFAKKAEVQDRKFAKGEKEVFAQIAIEIAKIWYSDDTTKVLAENFEEENYEVQEAAKRALEQSLEGVPAEIRDKAMKALTDGFRAVSIPADVQRKAMIGTEEVVNRYIREFLDVFLTKDQLNSLEIKPTFQVGYQSIRGVKANKGALPWMKKMVESAEFAGQTVPTDPAPEMTTGGAARVAGFDYGIYRRDGDGEKAPKKEYFRERLSQFMDKMNPKDYVCKMVQIGPVRTLLVMNRAYAHYMAEEMRLFPQFDLSPEDIDGLEMDSISFMGIPRKVMGDDYKVGYYMEEDQNGKQIPVSWVDAEKFTDYVGYLKKPLLTVANEKIKEQGGMPVHGSAFAIVFKNGLRKTLVIGGDSGAGKSETIIAMIEQAIKEEGEAKDVEGIDMLAGDMLSMYEGGDKQMYMMGTEEGDFMRMSDISGDWKARFRDKLKKASTTNKKHPTNPRKTIGGLCDPEGFLRPVRVNSFYYINNYTVPKGASFQEVKSPENLIMDIYAKGYRREKGTSGDQPNLVASLLDTEIEGRDAILRQYGEDLDKLLGWQTTLAESGKVKEAILSFRDKQNMIFRAKATVSDMFKGRKITDEDGENWTISGIDYTHKNNQFSVEMVNEQGQKMKQPLNRSIFDRVYSPVAATYCGNPFVHPKGMEEVLKRFAGVMERAGVITGVLYSQLAVDGEQFSGPASASRDTVGFLKRDPRVNDRFQKHQKRVHKALLEKYGEWVIGPDNLPEDLKAFNLFLQERHGSDTVKFVGREGEHIDVQTPKYKYNAGAARKKFNASLITPEVSKAINAVMISGNYKRVNLKNFKIDLSLYSEIKAWNNKEELVYQIMMIDGFTKLGGGTGVFRKIGTEVQKASMIADKIIEDRQSAAA